MKKYNDYILAIFGIERVDVKTSELKYLVIALDWGTLLFVNATQITISHLDRVKI